MDTDVDAYLRQFDGMPKYGQDEPHIHEAWFKDAYTSLVKHATRRITRQKQAVDILGVTSQTIHNHVLRCKDNGEHDIQGSY